MIRIKGKMRELGNRMGLVHESRIRDTDGQVLFRSRINSADNDKFAETLATTFEITGKNPDKMNELVKKKLSIDEKVKNYFQEEREADKKKVQDYLKGNR